MNDRWNWLVRYGVVIIVALLLAALLGSMDLFIKTRMITKGLTASHLARFLGFGGALVVLWLAAYRATMLLRSMDGARVRILEALLLPLATLVVVASAHPLFLLITSPLMDKSLREIFDWVFIAGIVGCAAWLLIAIFNESNTRTESAASTRVRGKGQQPDAA
jgi:hypothetical protein